MIYLSVQKKLHIEEGIETLSVETNIPEGEFVAVTGKSGAGKTSLLRMIAGLMKPEKGFITINKVTWLDTKNKVDLPVQKRGIGFVFQNAALFPNMTVLRNLQFAAGKSQDMNLLNRLLQMVGMESFAQRKPETLSGGQQQRISIIRALARKPDLLLLDEPFAALDAEMRNRLREELKLLHKEFRLTTILVTHDMSDIFSLAQRVIVLEKGKISRSGNPYEVFGNTKIDRHVQLKGEVLKIQKSGVVYIAEILTGQHILKLKLGEDEQAHLQPGSEVLVCSGAFDPVVTLLT